MLSVGLAVVVLAVAVTSEAQQPQKVGRLGAGSPADPLSQASHDAFRDGLRDLGWLEGKNIVIENRWVRDKPENARKLASELVGLEVEVIVAVGSPLVHAARQATASIPIVMAGSGADPVTAGFVASLQRPGGNVTGLSMLSAELSGKRIELLREVMLNPGHIGVLSNPEFPAVAIQSSETEAAAKALGVQLQAWEVRNQQEITTAFSSMRNSGIGGLIVFSDPVVLERHRGAIIGHAVKFRIPTIFPWRNYVEEGGLMSYSANLLDMHRRAATYVHKILKGAKPSDLPVEQPTKFELVINLKTAKQIGLTIPPNVLARADRVITKQSVI
jgi:putative ABC transport system substrate-binding protein